jgi:hypothetical protein
MPKIIEYKKVITQQNTYELREVEGTELCTIGDTTYFVIPGTVLPTGQAAEIQSSIKATVVTSDIRAQIKAASPHCWLIKERRKQRVLDAGYDNEDQKALQLAGIGIGIGFLQQGDPRAAAVLAYATVCKAADEAAAAQYVALGL